MRQIKRINRLIQHFKRIRDEKVGQLALVETRMLALKKDIIAIRSHRDDVNHYLSSGEGRKLDIQLMMMASAYKTRLKNELESKFSKLELVETEVENARAETTEAYRTQKIWENVKEKRETAEKEYVGHVAQLEMDELAQQKRHHLSTQPVGGIKSRTNR